MAKNTNGYVLLQIDSPMRRMVICRHESGGPDIKIRLLGLEKLQIDMVL